MDTSYVRIFDTTLRDGEQSPGASLTSLEKLEIARALTRLGVDVMDMTDMTIEKAADEIVRRLTGGVDPACR